MKKNNYAFITRLLVFGLFLFPLLLNAQTEPNDFCADAIAVECNATVSGSTVFATLDPEVDGTICGTLINTPGVWYTVVGLGGNVTASTCNSADYDTKISVFTGTCGVLICEGGLDDTPGCDGFTTEFTWASMAGTTYYVLVHGWEGSVGTFDLTVSCEIPAEILVSPNEFTFLLPLEGSSSDVMTISNTGAAGAENLDWSVGKGEIVPALVAGFDPSAQNDLNQSFIISNKTLNSLSSEGIPQDVFTDLVQMFDKPASNKVQFKKMLVKSIGDKNFSTYGMKIMEYASQWQSPRVRSESDILAEKYALVKEDNQTANPVILDAGGPDLFGYQYIDSNEAGGPAFSWTDISATGTEIITNGDWDVSVFGGADDAYKILALPFTFSFYGTDQTEVKVASNGYLTFGPDGIEFANDPIPDPDIPDNIICPFWDDINPADAGTIHYFSGASQFVVQYTGVPRFADPATSLTFQVILNADGSMLFHYLDMQGTITSSTIGIENVDASSGLQVVNNSPYVHNNLAVLLEVVCPWLTLTPSIGSTAHGASDNVTVNADAAGLEIDTYQCNLIIGSNAVNGNTVVVPVTMIVGTPLERIDDLIAKVDALNDAGVLNNGQTNALKAKLNAAKKSINKGKYNTAINQLNAFINQVNAFMNGGILTDEQGNELIYCANEIINLLQNHPGFKSGETDTENIDQLITTTYRLEQNYPNPFDGSTNISFSLAESQLTTLIVYNALGQEVAVLFNEIARADEQYGIEFNGSNQPKGVYFYQLKSGEYIDIIKKMILIK